MTQESTTARGDAGHPWACPICDGDRESELLGMRSYPSVVGSDRREFRARVLQCDACGLGMFDPMPDSTTIGGFYSDSYGSYKPLVASESPVSPHSLKLRLAEARFRTATAGRAVAKAMEWATGKTISYPLGVPLTLPLDANILELGFGAGDWLRTMHARGYRNLSGYDIEANEKNRDALGALGIEISTGNFLDNDYGEARWDCVRMEHVLEHVPDPVATLSKIRRLLKPSGILVMTLPCLNSVSTRVSLEHSPNGHEIPKHLYHYTPRALRLLLERSGFDSYRIRTYGDIASLVFTLRGRFQLPELRGRAGQLTMRGLGPVYALVSRALSQGEIVSVVAGDLRALPA